MPTTNEETRRQIRLRLSWALAELIRARVILSPGSALFRELAAYELDALNTVITHGADVERALARLANRLAHGVHAGTVSDPDRHQIDEGIPI